VFIFLKLLGKVMSREIVIVLGMHRSGTSLVTDIISKFGLNLGNKLIPPRNDNQKGFFEDSEIVQLNNDILNYLLIDWSSFRDIVTDPMFFFTDDLLSTFGYKAEELLSKKIKEESINLFKDPRFMILLPFWKAIFDRLKLNAKYVYVIRHPINVSKSLLVRDNLAKEEGIKLWFYYNLLCLMQINDDIYIVNYDSLFDDNNFQVVKSLINYININCDNATLLNILNESVSQTLRHNESNEEIEINIINELYNYFIKKTNSVVIKQDIKKWLDLNDVKIIEDVNSHICNNQLQNHQLYYDNGNGYEEEKSIIESSKDVAVNVSYKLNEDNSIKTLRFDPCDIPCLVIINSIKINNINYPIKNLKGNQILSNENYYFFNLKDANLQIENIKNNKIKVIEISFYLYNDIRLIKSYIHKSMNIIIDDKENLNKFKKLIDIYENKMIKSFSKEIKTNKDEMSGLVRKIESIDSGNRSLLKIEKQLLDYNRLIHKSSECINELIEINNHKIAEKDRQIQDKDQLSENLRNQIIQQEKIIAEKNLQLKGNKSLLEDKNNQIYILNNYLENQLDDLVKNERRKIVRKYKYRIVLRFFKRFLSFLTNPEGTIGYFKQYKAFKDSELFDEDYYLNNNSDLVLSWVNLIRHFILFGWKEGRNPSSSFDVKYYLKKYPDVNKQNINPLFHYLNKNKNEVRFRNKNEEDIDIIRNSHLFDNEFYLSTNNDVYESGEDPLTHYVCIGWKEGRDPSSGFSSTEYLLANPDVKSAEMNPLLHYILAGHREGRKLFIRTDRIAKEVNSINNEIKQNNFFENEQFCVSDTLKTKLQLVAIHLPQFHPIPENDSWWGKGFTEWTNVSKSRPMFPGHYQPQLPLEGFYDLRLVENLKRQVELAKSSGITGFCFYHYWFGGKKLLDKPVELFLENKNIDFDYCLCWANENWSRRWDGFDDDILIAQKHSEEDDIDFIKDISRHLIDSRYIKIEGKPLILVYRPGLLPDAKKTAVRWREYCKSEGIGEIYIAMVQGFNDYDPRKFGFDGAIEFPLLVPGQELVNEKMTLVENYSGRVHEFKTLVDKSNILSEQSYDLFHTVIPSWDNTARKGNKGTIYINSSPKIYEKWLRHSIEETIDVYNEDKRLVFINAWNEWAEGNHLEPDNNYGYAYLNATNRVVKSFEIDDTMRNFLFVSHDMSLGGAQIVLLSIMKWITKYQPQDNIFLLSDHPGELSSSFEAVSKVYYIDNHDGKKSKEGLLDYFGVKSFDLIYANSVASGKYFGLISKFDTPILSHFHELQKSIDVYASNVINEVINKSAHFIGCSDAVTDNLVKNYNIETSNIDTVYAFIDNPVPYSSDMTKLRKKLGIKKNARIILSIGIGLYWRKGADLFIETLIKLKESCNEEFTFLWIGSFDPYNNGDYGSWDSHLKKIKKYNLEKNCIFLETQSDIKPFLSLADIFYLPSREDPFPLVCLEAAGNSLPIICFDKAGGMPDFVKKGAGFVVPYLDTKKASVKIKYLIENKHKCNNLGNLAKELLLMNHITSVAAPFIYKSILNICDKKPLVSVIVPNYNYSKYLNERLNSIFNQTFKDFEVIILDDNSTDDSRDMIKKYKKDYDIRIAYNEINSGSVFAQWQKGVDLARGEYIWIAEADDSADPNFIESLLGSFDDPKVGISYCSSHVIDSESNVTKDFYKNCDFYSDVKIQDKWQSNYCSDGYEELSEGMAIKNTIPNVSGTIIRRDAFKHIDFDIAKKLKTGGDWYVYIAILANWKISYNSNSMNYHRRHNKSVIGKALIVSNQLIKDYAIIHNYILSIDRFNDLLPVLKNTVKKIINGLDGDNCAKVKVYNEIIDPKFKLK
jgi:glycosyltransferase involved in cell wall biosynthesis